MQILRSDIYLLALLLPFNVLLKCKNIELAIIIAFGLLLMTPKESLAVILSTASSTNNNISMMQNVDEITKQQQQLLHYDISNSNNLNSSWHKQVSNKSAVTATSGGGLIKCNNKLKCFDFNATTTTTTTTTALRTMRNGKDNNNNNNYESGNNLYEGSNNHMGKFNLKHIRTRRDHETNVIDTPSTLHERYIVQEKLMKNISAQQVSNSTSNHTTAHNQRNGNSSSSSRHEDLIKLKNSLEDLQRRNNGSTGQGHETSVDTTHSSYNGEFCQNNFFQLIKLS